MQLLVEIPENKASFMLELLRSFSFVKTEIQQDTTDYLLSNPANKTRLMEAVQQLKNGEVEVHQLMET